MDAGEDRLPTPPRLIDIRRGPKNRHVQFRFGRRRVVTIHAVFAEERKDLGLKGSSQLSIALTRIGGRIACSQGNGEFLGEGLTWYRYPSQKPEGNGNASDSNQTFSEVESEVHKQLKKCWRGRCRSLKRTGWQGPYSKPSRSPSRHAGGMMWLGNLGGVFRIGERFLGNGAVSRGLQIG